MNIHKYQEILDGNYNELFVSFSPPLNKNEMVELDNILINKQECKTVDDWSEFSVDNPNKNANGKSYEIKASLKDPIKIYSKIIYKYLNNKKKINTIFTVSDWMKYIHNDTDEQMFNEMLSKMQKS